MVWSLAICGLLAAGTAAAQDAVVPDDFATIGAAVVGATDGNGDGTVEILVRAGTYVEDVFVQRSNLTLSGEGAATTTIQGSGLIDTVRIQQASNVIVQGFTVVSGGAFDSIDYSRVNGGAIEANVLTGGGSGISTNRSQMLTIADNEIFGTTLEAIKVDRSARVTVLSNSAHDNPGDGITVDRAVRIRMQGNDSRNNGGVGLRDRDSTRTLYISNVAENNGDDGIRIESSGSDILFGNSCSGNISNGLRMMGTSDSLVTGNAFTGNLEWGVRRESWTDDDFDRTAGGAQDPPGDNDLSGNVNGPLRED
jgi:parallel beta-helix repeat protein